MNLLEQVNKCQNYIMFNQLHQEKSKITSQIKTSQTGRIFELKDEKLAKNPYAPRAFRPAFGALPGIQIELRLALWKALLSTFQPKWNFPIWCPFAPPKVHSPKTASCVSKKGQ